MTEEGKYHPLFEHLLFSGQGQKVMTFKEIEAVLGKPLPGSARQREEWWSNSPRGHSQAKAWMRASYKTSRVDLLNETVEFRIEGFQTYQRAQSPHLARPAGLGETGQTSYDAGAEKAHPLFGIWEGKVTLLPDVDYARPAFDPGGAP